MCAGSLCRPDDRTQIVRVLDAVTEYQQRRFALFCGTFQQFFQGNIGAARTLGSHALVDCAAGELGQLGLGDHFHRDALFLGEPDDLLETAALLSHIDQIDLGITPQRLQNGVASGNAVVFGLRCIRRLLSPAGLWFSLAHIKSSVISLRCVQKYSTAFIFARFYLL